jgi:hypothetical protein
MCFKKSAWVGLNKINTVTTLRTSQLGSCDVISDEGKRFSCIQSVRPASIPVHVLFKGTGPSFCGGKTARAWGSSLIPSGADEVEKEWSYTSTSPSYAYMTCTGASVSLPFFLVLVRKAVLRIGVSLDTAGIPTLPVAWSAAAPYS